MRSLEGTFPEAWKVGVLKVFLKSADKPTDKIKSYRPITLLPVLGKIVERVIVNKLNDWLTESQYFRGSQHGFMAGRSTISAMRELEDYVKASESRYVIGLFLDISGAFDNAWWPLILVTLRRHECPAELLRLLKSYLTNRTTVFEWEGPVPRSG